MSAVDRTTTLAELLRGRALEQGSQIVYTFLPAGETDGVSITYAELHARALAIADLLCHQGLAGQPVLLLCPSGLDYASALFGCFYAGCIAVPAYPPTRINAARVVPRTQAIATDAGAPAALVNDEVRALLAPFELLPKLLSVSGVEQLAGEPCRFTPDEPAILQYTSGSTALPKGVLLTHRQVLANLAMIQASGALGPDTPVLSWLPPFHDMGLFGALLTAPFVGTQLVFMPPEAFIRKPLRWLQAATRHQASVLVAPNFAFDLCVRRIGEQERAHLDLSSVRRAYCGAEQVRPETIERFARAFVPYGFRPEAFLPCYGLAEATLIVSAGTVGAGAVVRSYCAGGLEQGSAKPSPMAGAGSSVTRLVSVGRPLLGERICIVDPETRRELSLGQVGEIWVQSPAVASAYWRKPLETAETFQARTSDTLDGPFLRTGDLGFLDEEELFVTGRIKDLIIVRGRNLYPQDLEHTVQDVDDALPRDAGTAFAVAQEGGEQLVIVQEVDKRACAEPARLLGPLMDALREAHGITPADLVLVKRGTVLKTTSGKVQRAAMKRAYERGALEVVARLRDSAASDAVTGVSGERPANPSQTLTRPLPTQRRDHAIAAFIRKSLAERLGLRAANIDDAQPLARYGVDSLVAAELVGELEHFLGVVLPQTLSYDNPTVAQLARTLAELARPAPAPARARLPSVSTAPRLRPPRDGEEPIAIVGMACRFPGASDLAGFWRVLRNGVDAITEIPKERWDVDAIYDPHPDAPGTTRNRFAGLIECIDQFDAEFFGISPHEAARIDPQQRLFLELCWEALEDAGQSPEALAGSDTGVFAGVCTSDYATLYGGDLRLIDADYGTGSSPGIVPNRVSYFLDLKGPSEAVDSACASSLVALEHACRSLRDLRCQLALVGGVNALLAPETDVYFSQLGTLAADGRCKSFDSRADGFVRSEGGGVVVLKPLSRALADQDRIYALVAGCAVNHVGRSNGLLAPNGPAQQEVIRRALAEAGISADELQYVEAHGVGTPIADAVELNALGAICAGRRPPLLVGSAKTNVGHLEAASGMVALIKTALALHHEEIPPHLHLRDPLPGFDLGQLGIEIPTIAAPFRRGSEARFAGVSSFGFGGTNAHAVLREAPAAVAPAASSDSGQLLVLSARTPHALRTLSARFASRIAEPAPPRLLDVAFSAAVGRAHLPERLAVVAKHATELRSVLSSVARNEASAQVQLGRAPPGARPLLGFVFEEARVGPDAGRALYERHPAFRQALELAQELLRAELDAPLLDVLYHTSVDERRSLLERPSYGSAALVALQFALHGVLAGLGLRAAVVYGSGASEYAAAAACRALRWQDAVVFAARRGIVREDLEGGGRQRIGPAKLRRELAGLDYAAPATRLLVASRERAFAEGELPDGAFFARQLLHTPCATDGASLLREEATVHLGLGPTSDSELALRAQDSWLGLLSPEGDGWTRLLEVLGSLHVRGAKLDWRSFYSHFGCRKVTLPSYPFERERHWLDFPERSLLPPPPTVIERPSSHPLISRVRIHVPGRSGFLPRRREGQGQDGTGG